MMMTNRLKGNQCFSNQAVTQSDVKRLEKRVERFRADGRLRKHVLVQFGRL